LNFWGIKLEDEFMARGSLKPFEVVIARANMKLWLFSLSTRRIAHSGSVKPLAAGPAPCVCPVKELEEFVLAVLAKLEAWVEKQRNCSLK